VSVLNLPPMPESADPVIVPGLLAGLGITRRPIPAWITDPNVAESIACGLYELPDELLGETS
jgi:hypothetical protein